MIFCLVMSHKMICEFWFSQCGRTTSPWTKESQRSVGKSQVSSENEAGSFNPFPSAVESFSHPRSAVCAFLARIFKTLWRSWWNVAVQPATWKRKRFAPRETQRWTQGVHSQTFSHRTKPNIAKQQVPAKNVQFSQFQSDLPVRVLSHNDPEVTAQVLSSVSCAFSLKQETPGIFQFLGHLGCGGATGCVNWFPTWAEFFLCK